MLRVRLRPPYGWPPSSVSPEVDVDGQRVPADWGTTEIALPAGEYPVRAASRFMGRSGAVSTTVRVPADGVAEVHYSAPAVRFVRGRIGSAPQPRPGVVALVVALPALCAFMVGLATLLNRL